MGRSRCLFSRVGSISMRLATLVRNGMGASVEQHSQVTTMNQFVVIKDTTLQVSLIGWCT